MVDEVEVEVEVDAAGSDGRSEGGVTRAGDGGSFSIEQLARCLIALGVLHYQPQVGLEAIVAAVCNPVGVRELSDKEMLGVLEAIAAL